eukprot:gene5008-7691_t
MKQKQTLGTPRLLGIVWPFIAVVLFQALLGCVSLYVLSAVRGYVAGESLWSKGQKDAIFYLTLYADSRDEATFLKYQNAIAVPQGGHELRLALDRPTPDLPAARQGILKGGNHPDDVSSLIWLYLNFRHFSYLEKAIELWTVGDGYLVQLDDLAQEMHRAIMANQVSSSDVHRWKQRIFAINDGVTPAAKAFSDALGEGSRMILRLLLVTNLATALGLIVLALLRTHKLLAQRHAFADALQLEKERAQITLESIGDGVITTDVDGAIAYMNPAAEALTHWKAAQAQGLPLAALFNLLDENAQADGFTLIEHILGGQLGGGSEHSKLIQRLDGTTVSVTLVGAPIRSAGKVVGAVLNCPAPVAEKIAESLRHTVQSLHFVWKGRPFVTTVSIGLVHITHAPTTLETSLRAADMACYMAKEKGRNRVQVYHADDSELSLRFGEMAWVQRLHMALEENRFCLYAQEIAPLGHTEQGDGHIEILLRLHDEAGRIILPDSFIPAAERYGLMTSLDRWVVENVFKIIAGCMRERLGRPMAMCAINLSGTTIGDEDFLGFLREQFIAYGIPPEMISLLEIGVDYAQGYLIERPQLFTFDSLQCRPVRPQPLLFKAPGTFR